MNKRRIRYRIREFIKVGTEAGCTILEDNGYDYLLVYGGYIPPGLMSKSQGYKY